MVRQSPAPAADFCAWAEESQSPKLLCFKKSKLHLTPDAISPTFCESRVGIIRTDLSVVRQIFKPREQWKKARTMGMRGNRPVLCRHPDRRVLRQGQAGGDFDGLDNAGGRGTGGTMQILRPLL